MKLFIQCEIIHTMYYILYMGRLLAILDYTLQYNMWYYLVDITGWIMWDQYRLMDSYSYLYNNDWWKYR